MSNDHLALLLVDDEPFAAPLYKKHLENDHGMSVHIETDARCAKERALANLFDVLIIDAKIDYRGTMHGGLLLAHGARLFEGSQSHADVKPIKNIMRGLRKNRMDNGFQAIGPVGKHSHSGLCHPSRAAFMKSLGV